MQTKLHIMDICACLSLYLKVRMKIITIRSKKVHDKLILLLKKKRCNRSASNVARQD